MSLEEEILRSKILIVDDNPPNMLLLEQILRQNGYSNIYSTADPQTVVSLHQENNFDLILLDYCMPGMNGSQVIEALNKEIKDDYLPVLMLTALMDEETRVEALTAGAKDFLTKPFRNWEVLLRIHNMLETQIFYKRQRIRANEMERRVRQRTRDLHDTRLAIIHRLGRAGEYRDNETGMHVIRMSKSSQRLALAAGLPESRAEMILQASPMHDVGKIGIPDAILLKPGRLDPDEFEIMKTHAKIGADIIGDFDSDLMKIAREIALTHHEKWDGSGYPNNLEGEGIPIEGRICAICDVFDALTSQRPYKDAWPIEKAVDLINENSGSYFDPELVHLFNKILPDVMDIREKYSDVTGDSIPYVQSGVISTERVVFKDSYLIGNDTIDKHHRKLFDIINAIHDAIEDGEIDLCEKMFGSFQKVITKHFRCEERILQESGFQHYSEHVVHHNKFLIRAKDITQRYKNSKDNESLWKCVDELIHIFMEEVSQQDMDFKLHLKEVGLAK